jgi:hypothetical protein
MRRALRRIPSYDHVLVDGLKITGFEQHIGPYTAIVDGDVSSYAIACASVIAKVTRDRLMARLAVRYPGYGWEHNAGYATRDHVEGLRVLGVTSFHRRSFQRIRALLEGDQLAFRFSDGAVSIDVGATAVEVEDPDDQAAGSRSTDPPVGRSPTEALGSLANAGTRDESVAIAVR